MTTAGAATAAGDSLTIAAAGAGLRRGDLTCVGLATSHLERIAALDPELHAFVEVTGEAALRQAESLDAELSGGIDRGPLHGIPVSVKDLFDVAGVRTTAGSRSLADAAPAPADAAVVGRLRTAGAVFVGKNNLAEFAADMTGRNETFGDMRNPWDRDHSAGGSSGGTAAAVAAGMCLAGIGSDTGGSIRFPASVCGVVGARPTHGTVDLAGAFARAPSLDAAGPIARTVDDAALVLSAMTGRARPASTGAALADLTGLRLGLVDDVTFADLDPGIESAVREAVSTLQRLGAEVRDVEVPSFHEDLDHRRLFDVLLYEFHQALGERYRAAGDPALFGAVVRDNLARGAAVSRGAYESALAARSEFGSRARAAFATVDVLLTPTQPIEPPRLDAGTDAFDEVRRFLLPTSFLGLPSLSVPCGFSASGLPAGLQVVGDRHGEAAIMSVARAVERYVGWECLPARFGYSAQL